MPFTKISLRSLFQSLFVLLSFSLLLFLALEEHVLSGDVAWFVSVAQRVLAGISPVTSFWDTNPPYNFLFYVPVSALIQWAHVSPLNAVAGLHLFLIFLNAGVIFSLFADRNVRSSDSRWLIVSAYVTATLSFLLLGHKDSLVAAALPAVLLLQYAIDKEFRISPFLPIVLGVNALVLFLKPHFLILPAVLILYRLAKRRSLLPLLKYDHLVFLALGLLYTVITVIFFQDFLFNRVGIVWSLYANVPYETLPIISISLLCLGLLTFLLTLTRISESTDVTRVAGFLSIMGMGAIFVYFIQDKGFWEHLIPALTLILMASFLLVTHYIYTIFLIPVRLLGGILVLVACACQPFAIAQNMDSVERASKKFQEIIVSQAGDRSFFLEDTTTTIPYSVEMEKGNIQASYFPSMWMISGFMSQGYSSESECPELCGAFGDILLNGFEEYDPYMLFLYQDDVVTDSIPTMGLLRFFKDNKRFQTFMSHYTKSDRPLVVKYRDGQKRYSVYTKKI